MIDSNSDSIPDSDEIQTSDSGKISLSGSDPSGRRPASSPLVDEPWWRQFVSNEDFEDHKIGPKVTLLFAVLKECEILGDKMYVEIIYFSRMLIVDF